MLDSVSYRCFGLKKINSTSLMLKKRLNIFSKVFEDETITIFTITMHPRSNGDCCLLFCLLIYFFPNGQIF